jgi:uncharacterized protein (DUF1015 family)
MEIRPFRGWHYKTGADGDVSAYVALPYDVLSADDKNMYLSQSDRNVVAVDLPQVPPDSAGPDEVYRRAADLLNGWKASGVLVREASPAIYVYEQAFSWAGKKYARMAMICGVRASPPGSDVKLHEHTYPGPKADRLKLAQHTRTQTSPILGFYRDSSGVVADLLAGAAARRPDLQAGLRGVEERVWIVTDCQVVADIVSVMRDKPVFVADGHHRYMTALNYRDEMIAREHRSREDEVNFVMFALVEADNPGLLILPTHRIVRGLKNGFKVARLAAAAPEFSWRRCSVEDADLADVDAFLRRYGPHAIAFIDADPAEIWIGRLEDPKAMAAAAPDQIDPWRRLDVAILHKLIIDKALSPWRTDDLFIEYTSDAAGVLAACNSGRGQLGICLRGTPLSAVEEVALACQSMPHKSTYFFPKAATGLVFKPLE